MLIRLWLQDNTNTVQEIVNIAIGTPEIKKQSVYLRYELITYESTEIFNQMKINMI